MCEYIYAFILECAIHYHLLWRPCVKSCPSNFVIRWHCYFHWRWIQLAVAFCLHQSRCPGDNSRKWRNSCLIYTTVAARPAAASTWTCRGFYKRILLLLFFCKCRNITRVAMKAVRFIFYRILMIPKWSPPTSIFI